MAVPTTTTIPTFRGLNASGDWQGGGGLGSYAYGNAAIELDIKTSLQMWLGDWFLDLSEGIDWATYLGNRGTENAILLAVRKVLAGIYGVISVKALSVTLNAAARSMVLVYQVATIYSTSVTSSIALALPLQSS